MGELHVQVRLHNCVVEDRVVSVRSSIVIGDWPGAKVAFPGASVQVSRAGKRLRVLGKSLGEDESTDLDLGAVQVVISHTCPRKIIRASSSLFDRKFLATAIVMIAVGGWIDAADHWSERVPPLAPWTAQSVVQRWMNTSKFPDSDRMTASVRLPSAKTLKSAVPASEVTDGPRHQSDDRKTGVGYTAWYRHFVPGHTGIEQANKTLDERPDNIEARRLVARDAYHSGRFELAAWHYRVILAANPQNAATKIRLGWALRRQGKHQKELGVYQEILAESPGDVLALSGATTALARLGRPGEAQDTFDALQILAPTSPVTESTSAALEALQGQDQLALRSIGRALAGQEQLGTELQIELRQDIAMDPAFARLRTNSKLRALLRRTLGAAAPRTISARNVGMR